MQLTNISIARYGSLSDIGVSGLLPGLNVIYGANGSGKTSLLRFTRDLLRDSSRLPRAHSVPAAAGVLEIETHTGPVRIVRHPRPNHDDTVALIASTASSIEPLRQNVALAADPEDCGGLHFVEPAGHHRVAGLVSLAGALTSQLCELELGTGAAEPLAPDTASQPAVVMGILSRLCDFDDDSGDASLHLPQSDPDSIARADANWRIVIGALRQQREQLLLELDAEGRSSVRRLKALSTRLRWLNERAAQQREEITRLDADWQAAVCDLQEFESNPWHGGDAMVPARSHLSVAPEAEPLDARHEAFLSRLLAAVAYERMRVTLLAAGSLEHRGRLESVRNRLDDYEQDLLRQLDVFQQRSRVHETGAAMPATVCPVCGQHRETSAPAAADGHRNRIDCEHRRKALAQRAAALRQRLDESREQLAQICRSMARIDAARNALGSSRRLDQLQYAVSILDQQIVELDARHRAEIAAARLLAFLQARQRHDVLRRAGRHLSTLTSGRYVEILSDDETERIAVTDAQGAARPVEALSRGTSEQVVLALRIALLESLAELGDAHPVLWDEPLADCDEQRLDAAAGLLAAHSRSSGQVLLFTCREHVARTLAELGAAAHCVGDVPLEFAAGRSSEAIPSDVPMNGDGMAVDPTPSPVNSAPARVHPIIACWLTSDSGLDQVPSIGSQMVRRLRALGLNSVADLLLFDPAAHAGPLAELQVAAQQVYIWQGEARLLTRIEGLTGRDAQLLVSCGIFSPKQLAETDIDWLVSRIDRVRGGDTLRWRPGPSTAPRRETAARWIEAARRCLPIEQQAGDSAAPQPGRAPHAGNGSVSTGSPGNPPDSRAAAGPHFRLHPESPIVDAPSIGATTARRLQRVGIHTVRDLLVCDAQQLAARLRHPRTTTEMIVNWQRQAGLMCSIPELRCADAIVLVACGITGPADLRRISASALYAILGPYLETLDGRRALRGATPPTFDDIVRWIATVEESRIRRAA